MSASGATVLAVASIATIAMAIWFVRANGRFAAEAVPFAAEAVPDDDRPDESGRNELALTATDIGADLGQRVTLVQFSTSFCAPCRATRAVLSHVATEYEGVEHVEVDAEANLDLIRRVNVLRTPTTLVLDSRGRMLTRASGAVRVEQVRSMLARYV